MYKRTRVHRRTRVLQNMSSVASLGKRYRNEFEGCFPPLRSELEPKTKRRRTYDKMKSFYDLLAQLTDDPSSFECAGDRRLEQLRKILDLFHFRRSPDQCDFHEDFIVLCLQHIYKEDFEANRIRLMKAFGIENFQVGRLVTTPRRWGKTTSVSMFIAAMMLVCEGVTIATFAPGQRAATGLKSKVIERLWELPAEYQRRIVPDSKELLCVIIPSMMDDKGYPLQQRQLIIDAKKVNRLFAYPGSPEGESRLLGVGRPLPRAIHC